MREAHLQFCEGVGVRFPCATHLRLCKNAGKFVAAKAACQNGREAIFYTYTQPHMDTFHNLSNG